MDSKLNKLLDMLIATLEKGGDLIGEHVPKFFEEILAYEFMYSSVFASFWLFLFFLCFLAWVASAVKGLPTMIRNESMDTAVGCLMFFSVGLFILGVVLQHQVRDVIKIKMAPRVYTLEYLRDFKAGRK